MLGVFNGRADAKEFKDANRVCKALMEVSTRPAWGTAAPTWTLRTWGLERPLL